MKLYWHPVSLMPWRVKIALAEKGLTTEDVVIDLPGGAARTPEFLALNPFGQTPVLEDGDLVISESTAILEYLDERFPDPPLMPKTAAGRALARQYMGWSTDTWPFAWKRWVAPHSIGVPAGPEALQRGKAELSAHLDALARPLSTDDWLAGDYSLADICYAPLVLMASRFGLAEAIAERPPVARWYDRLMARPAVREGMAMLLG